MVLPNDPGFFLVDEEEAQPLPDADGEQVAVDRAQFEFELEVAFKGGALAGARAMAGFKVCKAGAWQVPKDQALLRLDRAGLAG